MALLTKPTAAAKVSLAYITIGSLLIVWTGVYCAYLYNNPPENHSIFYFCTALLLTGFVLVVIGLAVGRIGRAARHAELPPPEVTPAVAQTDQSAAATGVPSPETVPLGAAAASPPSAPSQPAPAVLVAPRPGTAATPFTPGR